MIVSMNVSHFVKICQALTILHQLICRGVANFGTQCMCWDTLPRRTGWCFFTDMWLFSNCLDVSGWTVQSPIRYKLYFCHWHCIL